MAITFPRTLPNLRFSHARFEMNDPVKASPSGAGLINYTRVADPTWMIRFSAPSLRESELALLRAWWMSLRGGLRGALVTQNVTCRPFAHSNPASAAPAQDAGILDSVTNGNELLVSSLDAGLILAPGDLIGIEHEGKYGLASVSEATGTGTSRTIIVEPFLRSYVAQAGAVVRFENPKLIMRPVPDSWQSDDGPRPTVSFQFVESPA